MARGIINRSDELGKLIFQQADKYNLPFMHICRRVGISYKRFLKEYANIKDLNRPEDRDLLPDHHLIEIAALVGINVRTTLVVRDEKAFEIEAKELKEKLKDEKSSMPVAREHSDALDALVSLGYSQQEAREALKKVPVDVKDLQSKIKIALKGLGK